MLYFKYGGKGSWEAKSSYHNAEEETSACHDEGEHFCWLIDVVEDGTFCMEADSELLPPNAQHFFPTLADAVAYCNKHEAAFLPLAEDPVKPTTAVWPSPELERQMLEDASPLGIHNRAHALGDHVRALLLRVRCLERSMNPAPPLTCQGCGLSNADEPSVRQRCCRVACNNCHERG